MKFILRKSNILVNKLKFIIICLLTGPFIMAQPGYRPGYVIKNNGDTLTGLVYYGCDGQLRKQCRFKRFEMLDAVVYKPADIHSYGFSNGRYLVSENIKSKKKFEDYKLSPDYQYTKKVFPLADFSLFKPFSRLNAGFLIQSEYVTIEIPSKSIKYFRETEYNEAYRTGPGFYVNYRLLRKSDFLWVGTSPFYINGVYNGFASYKNEADCRDNIILKYNVIQIPVFLMAIYTRHKIRPYVKAGPYGSFVIKGSYEHFAERQRENRIYQDWYYDFRMKEDFGFFSSAGIQLLIGHARQLGVEFSYKSGRQLLIYTEKDYGFPMDTKIGTTVWALTLIVNI